ncbi:MAG: metal ABC transporter permease [Azonexus sp.]|nr:metal ABC transporter permease [Betaproteobacteria bacterium]MBK8916511.1 metal ABC transporter permease [Betaproteobacteria bacterium]MBP6035703.1 metal ABC transporter permease [Azonexus sp.]MBP6906917.1 metal ABC transporter permease [Azonexus sp.]
MSDVLAGFFVVPFLTGLLLAVLLPVLGCYLRLRHEWLAALAYGNLAAAGSLAALALGIPLVVGGMAAAVVAVLLRRRSGDAPVRGSTYAFYLVGGWAVAVLLAANLPLAERLGHALFDGQLYFAERAHLLGTLGVGALVLPLLAALSKDLLLAEIFPRHHRLNGRSARAIHLGFDLLVVASLAAATLSLGVIAGFALAFVPPWLAFARGASWRQGLVLAVTAGVGAYVLAFSLALAFDQPFGPVLCLVLVGLAAAASGIPRGRRGSVEEKS